MAGLWLLLLRPMAGLWLLLLSWTTARARLAGTQPAWKRQHLPRPTEPPVPMLPCAAADEPRVSDEGQLRSGDVTGNVTLADDDIHFVAARGAGRYAAFDAASLRAAMRGRWLYFNGDSSLRGLYYSLLQQLQATGSYSHFDARGDEFVVVAEWMAERDPGDAAGRRAAREDPDSLAYGFVDAILDGNNGTLLWLRSEFHDGSHGWRRSGPGPDRSGELSAAWCGPRESRCAPGGRIRLTFRMLTTVEQSLADPTRFRVLAPGNASTRPDVHILEFGAWDRQLPASSTLAGRMRALVDDWTATNAAATTLVFASIPREWSALDARRPQLDRCLEGSWVRHVLAGEDVLFLNRVATTDAMRNSTAFVGACPCLAEHTYHPPHVANLLDVARLANMLFPRRPRDTSPTLRIRGGLRNCCCELPDRRVARGSLAYWARVCRLALAAPPR